MASIGLGFAMYVERTTLYFSAAKAIDMPLLNRGDAAAATWIRGDASRPRRGRDADVRSRLVGA